jgi:hypothetical protein
LKRVPTKQKAGTKMDNKLSVTTDIGPGLREFLHALGSINCELAWRVEETSSTITRNIMDTDGGNQTLIVKLQAFDRLRQEFLAIGEALQRCSEFVSSHADDADRINRLIAGISLSRLRTHLLALLSPDAAEGSLEREMAPEAEF